MTPVLLVSRSGSTVTIDLQSAEGFQQVWVYKSDTFYTGFSLLEKVPVGDFPITDEGVTGEPKYLGSFVELESLEIINTSTEIINTSTELIYSATEGRKSGSKYTR